MDATDIVVYSAAIDDIYLVNLQVSGEIWNN